MRFGLSDDSPTDELAYKDENNEVQVVPFRTLPGLTFDEVLQWHEDREAQASKLRKFNRARREELKAIPPDAEDRDEQVEEIMKISDEYEREIYAEQVGFVLRLVHPDDRESLRPALLRSHPNHVRGMVKELEERLVTKTADLVEGAGGVDPT